MGRQLEKHEELILNTALDLTIDHIKKFIGLTAKKFTRDDCLRNTVRGDGRLYSNCNAHSLWDKVVDFRNTGIHEWREFTEKSKEVKHIGMGSEVNVTRQKFYINTIVHQATAGMQVALLVYNIVNAWAVKICKWRYKHFENKDAIPAEGNRLCVEDPSETAQNMASHTLKEIVSVARESLQEMAEDAKKLVDFSLKGPCTQKEVWPFYPSLAGVNPRYCSRYYRGEYQAWIQPPSDPEKFRRGCCSMKAPYDDFGPWYTGRFGQGLIVPFGVPSESYMWANLVQAAEASLQPPLPARQLTLQSPRRRRTLYGYGGWGGSYYSFPMFGGFSLYG